MIGLILNGLSSLIGGIFSYLSKKQDVALEDTKQKGRTRRAEVEASVETLKIFKDDIDLRIARDIVVYPTCIYSAVTVWDWFVVLRYPDLVWGVKAIPSGSLLEFLPYAVMVFLFGNLVLNRRNT
jgi:hypothetical protein